LTEILNQFQEAGWFTQ